MKFERAGQSIAFVAKVNGVVKPDLEELFEASRNEIETTSSNISSNSLAILWSYKELRKVTLTLIVPWRVPKNSIKRYKNVKNIQILFEFICHYYRP